MCQCPLGLISHFYVKFLFDCDRSGFGVNALSGLYLISTIDIAYLNKLCQKSCVNALSGLYLISTVPLQKPRFYAVSRACFCRYLSEYSDNSRFSCMLTFWTYLMRCTSLDTGLSIALNTTVVILFFHSLDKLRCSTRGLAHNAFYLNNLLVVSTGGLAPGITFIFQNILPFSNNFFWEEHFHHRCCLLLMFFGVDIAQAPNYLK